ncbi:hypothetical protein [Caldilinea sp.]|uniref:hypothetical protein n=1 Tax=Caldilinea sp. TaxID=2293560 RepID=UPI0021DC1B4A|nr:hypothetical protein [Caldilinea sp.]GIV67311.1 MAG: hypothetical protein KatS3mg048_0173 [Caldilinea sp.]
MFTQSNKQMLWGALLILLGVLFLLQATGILGALGDLFWTLAFTAAGGVFLYTFLTAVQERWWAAIPGFTLLGLAATIFYGRFGPPMLAGVSGALFLGSIGLGFLAVFITNPRQWWAIIPGGVLVSLAGVAALDAMRIGVLNPASVLFVGLGATFGVLGLMSGYLNQNLRWAYIPAAILLLMGLVVVTPFVGALAWVWPLALIVVGAYLILRRSGASSAPLEVVGKQTEEADASTALEAGDERASRDVISR